MGRFAERFVTPRGPLMTSGWSLKSYEITLDGRQVDTAIRKAATRVAERSLEPISGPSVGFLILHVGTEAV